MDDIVRQAMAKWPNVPHCYGWLHLDARGNWRMRNEAAQASDLPGDRIANAALIDFIHRNYAHDEQGRWYFQNGPQRVYIDLAATPYIARTARDDPDAGLLLHTGEMPERFDAAWMTDSGRLVLKTDGKIAMLDDRDLQHLLPAIHIGNAPAGDALVKWCAGENPAAATIDIRQVRLPLERIPQEEMPQRFGYVSRPRPAVNALPGAP